MKAGALADRTFARILLIKPSAFGDVIHAVPVLAKLRARFPQARIDWLITPENAELVRYHPGLSHVLLFPRRDYARLSRCWSATNGLVRLLADIWRTRYDLVVDLHGQLRSTLFGVVSGAPVRVGFDRPRPQPGNASTDLGGKATGLHGWNGAREGSWLAYTHRIPIPTLDAHAVDRYLWLAPLLGLDNGPPDFRIYWPPLADARAAHLLKDYGLARRPFAILVPGTIWATKHWRVEGFAEVARYLLQAGLGVVVAGSTADRERCRAVVAACPGAHDFSGRTTLADFAALMSRSTINVTNDSGSMHLAVALQKPVVSVFGPTDPRRIGPYGRLQAVVQAPLACAGCYLRHLHDCPHDHACMKQVTGAMVIERLRQTLAA